MNSSAETMTNHDQDTYKLVIVSGGISNPSTTQMLAERVNDRVNALAKQRGKHVITSTINIRDLASEITTAMVSQLNGERLTHAIKLLNQADGLIASTPVYKAEPSGLFSSFFHILDNDLLIAKPVVLAATAGTTRHALVIDNHMRSTFAYLRTLTTPTSLFAASEDWNNNALSTRINRAAFELLLLMESGFAKKIQEETWASYQHEYGSAGGTELDIDLESDLMRLAAGGSSTKNKP